MKIKHKSIIIGLMVIVTLSGCAGGKSARSYYKDGIENFTDENYEEAKKNLELAIEKNSNRAEYFINYGLTLVKTGDYEKALEQFDIAIQEKDNLIARQNNKSAHRGKGIAYYESANYIKAMEEFNLALDIKESQELNQDILFYKGNSEEKAGEYEKAVITYTTILEEQPKDSNIYGIRADLYTKLGNYEKAEIDYDKALSLDPDNYELYFGKYFMAIQQGDTETANKVLEKVKKVKGIEKDPYNLGKIYYYRGDIEEATTQFNKAIEIQQSAAYFYLGEIYESKKDYEQAIKNYEKYIENEENIKSGIVYNQLGTCYIEKKEFDKALECIQIGIALNDSTLLKALKYNEIVAYENLIMFDEANEKIEEYVKKYPDDKNLQKEIEFIKTRITAKETTKDTTTDTTKDTTKDTTTDTTTDTTADTTTDTTADTTADTTEDNNQDNSGRETIIE